MPFNVPKCYSVNRGHTKILTELCGGPARGGGWPSVPFSACSQVAEQPKHFSRDDVPEPTQLKSEESHT